MDTFGTSQAVKSCVDELHKHFVKNFMPDYQYASLVAVLARGAKKHCRSHGESTEISDMVHDEIYCRGLDRWLESTGKATPAGYLNQAETEEAVVEFDYMFRHGRTKPRPVSKQRAYKIPGKNSIE